MTEVVRYNHLACSSNHELEEIFAAGSAPVPETLVGYEWRGFNSSSVTRLLGIQKFIKCFFAGAHGVEGYNIPVEQNGLVGQWIPKPSAEQPKRYAFFMVGRVDVNAKENLYPQALLLNYGASSHNPKLSVERLLRDYLVQPDLPNADLMLGKAYLALGPWRLFSNFFVIERISPTNWRL